MSKRRNRLRYMHKNCARVCIENVYFAMVLNVHVHLHCSSTMNDTQTQIYTFIKYIAKKKINQIVGNVLNDFFVFLYIYTVFDVHSEQSLSYIYFLSAARAFLSVSNCMVCQYFDLTLSRLRIVCISVYMSV